MQKIKRFTGRIITLSMEAGVFFLSFLQPVFAQDIQGGLQQGADDAAPTSTQGTELFGEDGIFRTITNILIFLIGAVSVVMLIVGGFRYVVSGGDSAGVEGAKNTILYAIIGIVVAFLAYAAVSFIISQLNN